MKNWIKQKLTSLLEIDLLKQENAKLRSELSRLKGVINTTFEFIDMNLVRDIDNEKIIRFSKGDEVEILKIIEDNSFVSGVGYVCLNTRNNESVTLDSGFIDFIK